MMNLMKRLVCSFVLLSFLATLIGCGDSSSKQGTDIECQDVTSSEKKILVEATKNSNFVYHMLSVAKCGYDNDYGDKYAQLYDQDVLEVLKDNASTITVSGGEHEGRLYGPLVASPAALADSKSIVEYYQEAINQAADIATATGEKVETIKAIADVFIQCFPIYESKVWATDKEKLESQIVLYQQKFDEMKLVSAWEETLGYQAKDDFHVLFVDSLTNGPEAILISDNQDIFTLPDPDYLEMKTNFISHELGVSIVKQNGFYGMTDSSELLANYSVFESVAEYYNRQIFDGYELQNTWDYDLVNEVQKIDEENDFKDAGELFWKAVEVLNVK